MRNARSLGELLEAHPLHTLPDYCQGTLTLGEMKAAKEKRELAAEMARAAFALEAARARFDRNHTTEAALDVRNCAQYLLGLERA